ncbi:hypothetical protein M758_UG267700 [Ceratodon purpureus]|nr:hypothetical protein M758_UG267700 [Ceratodon purpureus]
MEGCVYVQRQGTMLVSVLKSLLHQIPSRVMKVGTWKPESVQLSSVCREKEGLFQLKLDWPAWCFLRTTVLFTYLLCTTRLRRHSMAGREGPGLHSSDPYYTVRGSLAIIYDSVVTAFKHVDL